MIADVHSLTGAYALDAVDDLERAAVERHLKECEACRTEVAELRETAARLADGTWSVPPPRLRERVLAEVATARQLRPAPPPAQVGQRPRMSRRHLLTAAAAVVVAAGGAGTAVYAVQEQRVRDQRVTAEAARAQEERIRGILAASDVLLRDQPLPGGGKVTVAYSRLRDAGVILLAADAPPAGGKVYQLWTVRSEAPVSEGPLRVGESSATKVVDGMSAASAVAVSVEPPGGSAAPTERVAAVKLT